MTRQEVLNYLRGNSAPGDWVVMTMPQLPDHDHIRHAKTHECPLCWLASQMNMNPDKLLVYYPDLIDDLGITLEEALFIALAADYREHQLRQELETACHLSA